MSSPTAITARMYYLRSQALGHTGRVALRLLRAFREMAVVARGGAKSGIFLGAIFSHPSALGGIPVRGGGGAIGVRANRCFVTIKLRARRF
jgi:hypothetical protein